MKLVIYLVISFLSLQGFSATEDEIFEWYTSLHKLPSKKLFLKEIERERLFRNARYHKVAALEHLSKYDPSGLVGFCFGRAMTVHLLARKMGLDNASVRKLFVIGDLRQGPNPEWRFHVTTLVKGEDGLWWAVDPIMQPPLAWGGALKMEEWMRIVQTTWDKKQKAHFYLVDNSTVIPDLREVPEPDLEKGEKIIEVKFDPTKTSTGFVPKTIDSREYFEVDEKVQHQLMTNAFEVAKEDRFLYLDMTINGEKYDYHSYFVDLLTELKKDGDNRIGEFADDLPLMRGTVLPNILFSPRVDRWFR